MVVAQTTGFDSKVSSFSDNGNKKVKDSKNSIPDDFMSYLNVNVNVQVEQKNDTKVSESSNNNTDTDSDNGYYYKEKNTNNISSKPSINKDKLENNKISDNESEDNLDYDIIEKAIETLQDTIINTLDISLEDLDSIISDMGIEMSDLLDKNNLVDFILNFNGAEKIDLITNEELGSTINQLTGDLSKLIEQFDLQDVELDDLEDFKIISKESLVEVVDNNDDYVYDDINLKKESKLSETNETHETNVDITINKKVSSETSNNNTDSKSDDNSSNKNISHQEAAADIINNLNKFVEEVDPSSKIFSEEIDSTDIINQIIENIKIRVNQDTSSMELQLYPEHLGKIQLQVSSKNGIVTASIVAENEAAKTAIESGLSNLKEALNNQELKIEAVEVSVATTAFSGQRDGNTNDSHDTKQSKSSRRINLKDLEGLENLDEDEELEIEMMKVSGNSVSYQA